MKHQILLKSFLLLALIFAFSSLASASEVFGTLSSDGLTNVQSTTSGGSSGGSTIISSGAGSISGTVSGGASSSNTSGSNSSSVIVSGTSGGIGIARTVQTALGASAPAVLPSTTFFSADGTAFGTSSNNLALGGGTGANPITALSHTIPPSSLTASALGAFGNLSLSNWFWIIFLLLLLLVVLGYIYSHNNPNKKKLARV
jgi:hypothetical protein